MYKVPDDYLRTYDPNVAEIHSDSSDFEGTHSSVVTHTKIRRKLSMNKLFPYSKKDSKFQTCNSQIHPASENSSKETWGSVTTSISQNGLTIGIQVQKTYKNKKYKILEDGDKIETIKSKRSVIRQRVRPCLSSLFGCSSNNVKQMSIIKENPTENVYIDNGCQATGVNREHKIRKFNRRQECYAAQPVYAVEGNIHAKQPPFQHTKIVREPLSTCKAVGNGISEDIYSLTSSSEEVETHRFFKRKKGKRNKPKDIVESGIGKEFFERYERRGFNHIEQQCPSKKGPISPFQIYTTPYQNQTQHKSRGCSPMTASLNRSGFELGTACSGFWEYIVNKLNTKMQPLTQPYSKKSDGATNTPPFKPCSYCADPSIASYCCCPDACGNKPHKGCPPPTKPERKQEAESCSCCLAPVPCSSSGKIKTAKKNNILCKCPPTKDTKSGPGSKNVPALPRAPEAPRPCQLDHGEITKSLSGKYNGEILCIHNPPCVLINGCLNLPPPKGEETMDLYSVTTDVKSNTFGYQNTNTKRLTKQKSDQYRHPALEMQRRQNTDAACQYLPVMKENKSRMNNMKTESCQYQMPYVMQKSMPQYGIHYHSSPYDVRKQQTTDSDSCEHLERSTDIQKHQATAIESYKYWLAPDEIRQQITSPETYQYPISPIEIQKQPFTSDDSRVKLKPVMDVKQIKKQRSKNEKLIQSICNHKPPCEVVRTCCKTRLDPKLQNSCVHVPMCENVPLCLMELKNQNPNLPSCKCPHKPKCTEVPICTRNYIVLTAKEEVATQVRPKTKMVCRHEPPCIMIPTCLARVCDSYIPYDSIPHCIHQPTCEMIPACCRKSAKEMVSVRSQYPSQCCIV